MSHLRFSVSLLITALRWFCIASLVGVMAGIASAFLLHTLDFVTGIRESHRWLIALLPFAGFAMAWLYHRFGGAVERGNNLLLEEIHQPGKTIPLRMTPLILLGTFVTHLFGGSAGREGTAIQTGASLADQLAIPLRLSSQGRRLLLMSGISAGFASVFGVPLAGTVFGMEVLVLGAVSYEAIGPCLIASFAGDLTTRLLYAHHAHYSITFVPSLHVRQIILAMFAGSIFGVTARGFAFLTHGAGRLFARGIAYPPLRPMVGGAMVSAAVFLSGSTTFIGLGTSTIAAAFTARQPWYSFAAKIALTVVTLGSGFKGGEVTPLFFIGSTLGNALSAIIALPPPLLAGMGLVAVFAGAANTPIASLLMGVELFGGEAGIYCGIACVFSYLCSGHGGIYQAQRIGSRKYIRTVPENASSTSHL